MSNLFYLALGGAAVYLLSKKSEGAAPAGTGPGIVATPIPGATLTATPLATPIKAAPPHGPESFVPYPSMCRPDVWISSPTDQAMDLINCGPVTGWLQAPGTVSVAPFDWKYINQYTSMG